MADGVSARSCPLAGSKSRRLSTGSADRGVASDIRKARTGRKSTCASNRMESPSGCKRTVIMSRICWRVMSQGGSDSPFGSEP